MWSFLTNIFKKWGVFIQIIILDPWTFLFLLTSILLLYISGKQNNPTIITLLSSLLSISSAVVGARILKQWVDINEGGIVVARGNAAVRGLKLLLTSIISLDKRINQYISQDQNKESINPMIINLLNEIKGRCDLMTEEAVNSIENWTDIIPEANIKTQIGVISEYKGKLESSNLELGLLKEKLKDTEGKTEKEIKALTLEVKKKEIEISK